MGDSLSSVLPPSHLGRYEVIDRLGAGGMAEVLLCIRHGAADFVRAVAVKRVLPFLARDQGFRKLLRQEAAIAAMAQHPNCVRVDELEDHEGELLLSMELLYGLDAAQLAERMKARGEDVAPDVVVRVLADVARGLHHVHELRDQAGERLGVVHRDVSPHNVFLTESGQSKILDFGIATAMEAVDGDTRTGALKGKVRYMAPEQAGLKPLDARTDVWALGVTAWELICGATLFEGPIFEVLDAIRDRPAPSVRSVRPEVPEALASVIEKALTREMDGRYQTAEELADAFEAAVRPAEHRKVARLVHSHAGDEIRRLRARVARALQVVDRLGGRAARATRDDARAPTLLEHSETPSHAPVAYQDTMGAGATRAGKRFEKKEKKEETSTSPTVQTPKSGRDTIDEGAYVMPSSTTEDDDEFDVPTNRVEAHESLRPTLSDEADQPAAKVTRRTPASHRSFAPPSKPVPQRKWLAGLLLVVGALVGWGVAELVLR